MDLIVSNSGFQRSTKLTTVLTPAVFTAARMALISSRLLAMGFSMTTCFSRLRRRDGIFGVKALRGTDAHDVHAVVRQGPLVVVVQPDALQAGLFRASRRA